MEDRVHAYETYRSLVPISLALMLTLVLLNAIGVWFMYDHNLMIGVRRHLVGVVIAIAAIGCSYATQLMLYNESLGRLTANMHVIPMILAVTCCTLSLGCFIMGVIGG